MTVLVPPTNIASLVRTMQDRLFRKWGNVSSIALEPMIVLGFSRDTIPNLSSARIFDGPFSVTGLAVRGKTLSLDTDHAPYITGLSAGLGLTESSGPFEPVPGFNLGMFADGETVSRAAASIPTPSVPSWKVMRIAVYLAEFETGGGPWFDRIILEEVSSRWMKTGQR